jgi:hypothetical protein
MRKILFTLVPAIGLLLPPMGQAQGTLYVSNLGLTPNTSASIGNDAWIAQSIITGIDSSGYILNSVQLLMDEGSGSPSGFNVSIYSFSGSDPQNNLGSLTGSDPMAGGLFTYATSGIMLSPSTVYFVVLTAATPVSQGAYDWSALAEGGSALGINQWIINDSYYSSANGSSWTGHNRYDTFQLAIYATAVPEPATLSLAGMSLACLSCWRLRQAK